MYFAYVNLNLSAASFDDLAQKLKTLNELFPVASVNIGGAASGGASLNFALGGGANTALLQQGGVAPAAATSAALTAAAPAPAAAEQASTKPTKPAKPTNPVKPKAETAPEPAAPEPAPAPAAPKGKSHAELIADLRAVLSPVASASPEGRKKVNAFIVGKGYKMVSEAGIPADVLPGLIEAAKKELA